MSLITLSEYLFKPKCKPLNCFGKLPNSIQLLLFKHYLNDRDRFMMDMALKWNLRSVSESEMNRAREHQLIHTIETEKWNLYDYRDNIEYIHGVSDYSLIEEEEEEGEEGEEDGYVYEQDIYENDYGYMYELYNLN
jgi:hypothetical protein